MSEDLYNILGLERSASGDQIKRAYRTLARKYHPDAQNPNASETLFRKVSEAYSVLSSAKRREKYDETLGISPGNSGSSAKSRNHVFEKMDAEPQTKQPEPAPIPPQPYKDSGIFGRITKLLSKKNEEPDFEPEIGETGDIRGGRVYNFSIDGLESLTGTSRELALRSENDRPRMLRVKIPSGSCDGDLLRVNNEEEDEEYLIKVSVTPNEFVCREGRDIILRLPITMGESLTGVDLVVPLQLGTTPLSIPPKWDVKKRIRLKGRGIVRDDDQPAGDLYIELVIVSPDLAIPQVEQIATLLDEGYSSNPRVRFPKDFSSKR